MRVELGAGQVGDVDDVEGVQPFGEQDLGVVAAERIAGGGDDEDRAARTFARRQTARTAVRLDGDRRADAAPRLPLSSTARLRIVTAPELPGVQAYVHVPRPLAGCQVGPPSTVTSTPPTTPPPLSVAVPVIAVGTPLSAVKPFAGSVIVAVGAA